MKLALLLVDLQHDFLNRPGLIPGLSELSAPVASILAYARENALAVAHVRTRVNAAGTDRMPHWQQNDIWECVAGTAGELAPEVFSAQGAEPIFYKQFFSGFGNPELDLWLQGAGVEELWVVGVYTQSCVRATVMDAYERGYRVTVVEDGIASIDPLHAQISRDFLGSRAARFVSSGELLNAAVQKDVHYNPHEPEKPVVAVARTTADEIGAAVLAARSAAVDWGLRSIDARRQVFGRFVEALRLAEASLVELLVRELGKPWSDATGELARARGHLSAALELDTLESIEPGATVVYQPHGVVAVITPWNNPVAIPVGKLASALLLGNSVVWKPAFQADNISRCLLALLQDSGLPKGLVQLVNGGASQVCDLVGRPDVSAVSLTGPEQAGRTVAAICRPVGKPLQAELGGNNALLVLADADLPGQVNNWARQAFGFAGQRCTAVRRFVVERPLVERFETLFAAAMDQLQLRNPALESCDVGPLISSVQLTRVSDAVKFALGRGARVVAGGPCCTAGPGHYFQPTLLADLDPGDPLVQEELFGPVAILQVADDFEHGMRLVNGVRQGLLAGIATASDYRYETFVEQAEAGILIDGNGMRIHPAAPFGGCKMSQIGPPEHGVWDRQFFSRVQMRYRGAP